MADDNDNFSNVSWSEPPEPDNMQPYTSDDDFKPTINPGAEVAAAAAAAAVGGGGHAMGEERLDCTVGSPVKENDGTKDAFISYQVTTQVSQTLILSLTRHLEPLLTQLQVLLLILPKRHNHGPPPLH